MNDFSILYIFVLLLLISICLSFKNIQFRQLSSNYEIIITIKGDGIQKILSDYDTCRIESHSYSFDTLPDEIIINGINQIDIAKSYNLPFETNEIKMIWNTEITSFKAMFCGLTNLKGVEVKSNNSYIEDLSFMFGACSELETINFTNYDSSHSIYTGYMFQGCTSLKSLDLSNFNTYNVIYMNYMFSVCTSLESLKLGANFVVSSVKNMAYMFNYCALLKSLDLSSFDTSNVQYMNSMFKNCYSLEYLDISNFNTDSKLILRICLNIVMKHLFIVLMNY